ncbi:MAG: dienelactone hydrolase family protein [Fulvivirga sp.]|uniref:dienelactone hydrolase family protein n=2 Tax=Fulvivirga sp. TaxID=1931237 RepID=UPI0032EC8E8A
MTIQIPSYNKWSFTAMVRGKHPITHDVYSRGEGKLLVLIQELPGIGQETLALADQFVNRGYKVILPHLFGPLGKTSVLGNTVRILCMRKEFKIFSTQQSSPIVDWLKTLCRKVKDDHQVKGVAVIGMCLTGNFAISLMADEAVLASYSSQPSLPVFKQKSLHLSDTEVEKIKTRLDEFGPMHCARFAKDPLCRASKFDSYERTFNEDKERIVFHTLPGKGHSIVTLDFVDEAGHPTKKVLDEVMDYFDRSLNT